MLHEDLCSKLNCSSSFNFQVQRTTVIFLCLAGLVPPADHVAVMFIYTVQSNICLYDVHS